MKSPDEPYKPHHPQPLEPHHRVASAVGWIILGAVALLIGVRLAVGPDRLCASNPPLMLKESFADCNTQ